jgi:hypothetical protein
MALGDIRIGLRPFSVRELPGQQRKVLRLPQPIERVSQASEPVSCGPHFALPRTRLHDLRLRPLWNSTEGVLKSGNAGAMIKYYRDLLNAFVAGRRAHGERWLEMPFPAYAPVVSRCARTARTLQSDLSAWGIADKHFGEAIARVRAADYHYLATNQLTWAFANYATLHASRKEEITGKKRMGHVPVERARAGVRRALLAVEMALSGELSAKAPPQDVDRLDQALAAVAQQENAVRTYVNQVGAKRAALGEPLEQLRAWKSTLERLKSVGGAGLLPRLEPALSLLLTAASTIRIGGAAMHVDHAAWASAGAAERALDRAPFFVRGPKHDFDGFFDVMALAISGRRVPLPTFSPLTRTDISAAFAARVAPLGLVLDHDPVSFVRHDYFHTWSNPHSQYYEPIESYLAGDGPAILEALTPFVEKIGRDDQEFFAITHEQDQSPNMDPRFAAGMRSLSANGKAASTIVRAQSIDTPSAPA